MYFVKCIRVGEVSAQTGICAKADDSPMVNSGGEILRIGVAEYAPAQSDESALGLLCGELHLRHFRFLRVCR